MNLGSRLSYGGMNTVDKRVGKRKEGPLYNETSKKISSNTLMKRMRRSKIFLGKGADTKPIEGRAG